MRNRSGCSTTPQSDDPFVPYRGDVSKLDTRSRVWRGSGIVLSESQRPAIRPSSKAALLWPLADISSAYDIEYSTSYIDNQDLPILYHTPVIKFAAILGQLMRPKFARRHSLARLKTDHRAIARPSSNACEIFDQVVGGSSGVAASRGQWRSISPS
jgi:hypothetical protein